MHRLLVLSAFFTGYVLGFFRGRSTGRTEGKATALLGVIKGHNEALRHRKQQLWETGYVDCSDGRRWLPVLQGTGEPHPWLLPSRDQRQVEEVVHRLNNGADR